jgi:hypothetical protein
MSERHLTSVYTGAVSEAVRSGTDVWGNRLLASPGGPTVAGARRFLAPLLFAARRFDVPEPRLLDAERATLVQQLLFGWRYSVGNGYEELSLRRRRTRPR